MRALILCLFIPALYARVDEVQEVQEYMFKALLLGKIADFVEWPNEEVAKPFRIGILGKSPLGNTLVEAYASHPIKGRRVEILAFSNLNEVPKVDILFICASERFRIQAIVAKLADTSILTIGDSEDYAQAGVMVNILVLKRKPNFQVNLRSVRQAKLKINSHFLRFAKEVIQD